jgi:hypothetical protein
LSSEPSRALKTQSTLGSMGWRIRRVYGAEPPFTKRVRRASPANPGIVDLQSTPRPSGRRQTPMTRRRTRPAKRTAHAAPHDPTARSRSRQLTAPGDKVWHNAQRPKPSRRLFKSGWSCDGPDNDTPAATRSRPVPASSVT